MHGEKLTRDLVARRFAILLLQFGNGNMKIDKNEYISLSNCIILSFPSIQDLINRVYPNIKHCFLDSVWLCERAIFNPKNKTVDRINWIISQVIPKESKNYISIGTMNYPMEFLNSLNFLWIPLHKLELNVNLPVMLLRNLGTLKLCNE